MHICSRLAMVCDSEVSRASSSFADGKIVHPIATVEGGTGACVGIPGNGISGIGHFVVFVNLGTD